MVVLLGMDGTYYDKDKHSYMAQWFGQFLDISIDDYFGTPNYFLQRELKKVMDMFRAAHTRQELLAALSEIKTKNQEYVADLLLKRQAAAEVFVAA
jgi:hypothetical protein